jgi:carboxypeptidase Q
VIDWVIAEMKRDNLTAVKEEVSVTRWTRGEEWATIITSGSERPVQIHGLVGSVGGNFTSEFVVVADFEELLNTPTAAGRLVVFNTPWVDGETSMNVVRNAAIEAARAGAIGCLVRSATPFSLGTMHTGAVEYAVGVTPIPCASITVEEATTLQGLYDRKRVATIRLWMDPQEESNATSYNIIATLDGGDKKAEVVVIGAHIDTFELGQGVQDSLAGFVQAWESLRIMKYHQMVPLRTVRLVGWTGSVQGHLGAKSYAEAYAAQTVFALEANQGASRIEGIVASLFEDDDDGYDLLKDIGSVMSEHDADEVDLVDKQDHTNIASLFAAGVPVASFKTDDGDEQFWWYANSDADTIDTVDADDLRENGSIMATYAFCIANSEELPKKKV